MCRRGSGLVYSRKRESSGRTHPAPEGGEGVGLLEPEADGEEEGDGDGDHQVVLEQLLGTFEGEVEHDERVDVESDGYRPQDVDEAEELDPEALVVMVWGVGVGGDGLGGCIWLMDRLIWLIDQSIDRLTD